MSLNENEEWGWEDNAATDDADDSTTDNEGKNPITIEDLGDDEDDRFLRNVKNDNKNQSSSPNNRQSQDPKYIPPTVGPNSSKKGITSSPSFQELERAIGATLNMTFSSDSLAEQDKIGSPTRISQQKSLQQQKIHQQRHQKIQLQLQQQPQITSQGSRQQQPQNYLSKQNIPQNQTSSSVNTPVVNAKVELSTFINESESRAIILFHSVHISAITIRDACQKCGVLYYIRPEFHGKGVTLLSYFDLRSATHAHDTLGDVLSLEGEASAHYSIMLHNNNSEEFRLILQQFPEGNFYLIILFEYRLIFINSHNYYYLGRAESEVQSIFSRYGQLRSISRSFGADSDIENSDNPKSSTELSAYSIEYFNIQDSRLAASELSATSVQVWGRETTVTFAPLDSRKQQLCRQLLATLSRWRNEISTVSPRSNFQASSNGLQPQFPMGLNIPQNQPMYVNQGQMPMMNGYNQMRQNMIPNMMHYNIGYQQQNGSHSYNNMNMENQMKIGDHTSKTNRGVNNQNNSGDYNGMKVGIDELSDIQDPYTLQIQRFQTNFHQQNTEIVYAPNVGSNSLELPSRSIIKSNGNNYENQRPTYHNGGHGQNRKLKPCPNESDFLLDLDRLLDGIDTRTTVMVRNIPNKYTQQMLLEEVDIGHKGTYDFFYLPIDFKNKCNVGYFFVNFLEPKHIVPFVKEFNGQRWKSFNSEKVCAVSFARIQGKSAMVSRFQNSSLLEKDNEYRPLLFYSEGIDKGKHEPFPFGNRIRNQISSNNSDDILLENSDPN
jgi:hypothetical protein